MQTVVRNDYSVYGMIMQSADNKKKAHRLEWPMRLGGQFPYVLFGNIARSDIYLNRGAACGDRDRFRCVERDGCVLVYISATA